MLLIFVLAACENEPRYVQNYIDPLNSEQDANASVGLILLGQEESIMIVPPHIIDEQLSLVDTLEMMSEEGNSAQNEITEDIVIDSFRERIFYSIITEVDAIANSHQALLQKHNANEPIENEIAIERLAQSNNNPEITSNGSIKNPIKKPSNTLPKEFTLFEPNKEGINKSPIQTNQNHFFLQKTEIKLDFWRFLEKIKEILVNRVFSYFTRYGHTDLSYFKQARQEKYVDPFTPKFNKMQSISLTEKNLQSVESLRPLDIDDIQQALSNFGERITLGMIPIKGTLEDAKENNRIFSEINKQLIEINRASTIDSFIKQLDSLKNDLVKISIEDLSFLTETNEYQQLKETLQNDVLLDKAIDIERIQATKQLNQYFKDNNYSLDKQYQTIDDISQIRSVLSYFPVTEIDNFKTKKAINLDNTEKKGFVTVEGDIERLRDIYDFLFIDVGPEIIDRLVTPRQFSEPLNDPPIRLISIVEQFELASFFPSVIKATNQTKITLPRGRYKAEFSGNAVAESLGMDNLSIAQFSSRDREMLTPELLNDAIDYIHDQILKTKNELFIHCKSGVGRSASVVTGSRADRVIELINQKGIKLTESQVTSIVDSQIQQIIAARPVVKISPPQKANIVFTLFNRQDTRVPLTRQEQ